MPRHWIFMLCLSALVEPLQAQTWPSKTIRAIVTVGPGTSTDLVARSLGQSWGQSLGQPVVIENRPGASGIIGTEACARAAPDGYTLCFTAWGQMSANPFLFAKLPYDPAQDFAPVVKVSDISTAIVVHASVPANSMGELIALAGAKPGTITWASWGLGSPSHLYLGWVEARTGGKFLHVPYKETVQAWNAVLGGEAQVIANTTGIVAPMIKAGKVKAVGTIGARRSPFLPGVPTFIEQGLDFQTSGWIGLLAQHGAPREAVQRLNAETNKLLASQEFVAKSVLPLGLEPSGGSPEEFAVFLRENRALTADLIKLANLKPQ